MSKSVYGIGICQMLTHDNKIPLACSQTETVDDFDFNKLNLRELT